MVAQSPDAFFLRAMRTTENFAARFYAVPDHPTVAMCAVGRHGLDGALEAIEGHSFSALAYTECIVVVVSANVAIEPNIPRTQPYCRRSRQHGSAIASVHEMKNGSSNRNALPDQRFLQQSTGQLTGLL
jgi:hypothetical protein